MADRAYTVAPSGFNLRRTPGGEIRRRGRRRGRLGVAQDEAERDRKARRQESIRRSATGLAGAAMGAGRTPDLPGIMEQLGGEGAKAPGRIEEERRQRGDRRRSEMYRQSKHEQKVRRFLDSRDALGKMRKGTYDPEIRFAMPGGETMETTPGAGATREMAEGYRIPAARRAAEAVSAPGIAKGLQGMESYQRYLGGLPGGAGGVFSQTGVDQERMTPQEMDRHALEQQKFAAAQGKADVAKGKGEIEIRKAQLGLERDFPGEKTKLAGMKREGEAQVKKLFAETPPPTMNQRFQYGGGPEAAMGAAQQAFQAASPGNWQGAAQTDPYAGYQQPGAPVAQPTQPVVQPAPPTVPEMNQAFAQPSMFGGYQPPPTQAPPAQAQPTAAPVPTPGLTPPAQQPPGPAGAPGPAGPAVQALLAAMLGGVPAPGAPQEVQGVPNAAAPPWTLGPGGYAKSALSGLSPEQQQMNISQLGQERDKLFAQAPQPAAPPSAGGGLFGKASLTPAQERAAAQKDRALDLEERKQKTQEDVIKKTVPPPPALTEDDTKRLDNSLGAIEKASVPLLSYLTGGMSKSEIRQANDRYSQQVQNAFKVAMDSDKPKEALNYVAGVLRNSDAYKKGSRIVRDLIDQAIFHAKLKARLAAEDKAASSGAKPGG